MSVDQSEYGLIIFLRLPEKGKVKTRLAASIGEEAALEIYLQMVNITLEAASQVEAKIYLFYDGGLPPKDLQIKSYDYLLQQGNELGEKIFHAFEYVLSRHSKAIIIGSDCPEISSNILLKSFQLLQYHDITLGPAFDGGYYLLGCKKLYPSLFHAIPWSQPSTMRETINRIEDLKLTYQLMDILSDIDTVEDWECFQRKGK